MIRAWIIVSICMCAICTLGSTQTAQAHDSRPLSIQLQEIQPGTFKMQVDVPPSLAQRDHPHINLVAPCEKIEGEIKTKGRALFTCPPKTSLEMQIDYPFINPALSTLIQIKPFQEALKFSNLPPNQNIWRWERGETSDLSPIFYIKMGILHILKGIDHLLFLILLLLMARNFRQALGMVTGFTIAHSITLALSALGLVHVSIHAVEILIALSIVFLAREHIMPNRQTLAWSYPVLVSMVFGLLHGFGFASVLMEIGLPEQARLMALLMFNIGVEIGQILFIATLSLVGLIFVRIWPQSHFANTDRTIEGPPSKNKYQTWLALGIGVVASIWFFQRLGQF